MINLLPSEEKKILETEEKWRLMLLIAILIMGFFLCLILILYSIKIYVAGKAESEKIILDVTRQEFEKPEIKEFKNEISVSNKTLIKLNNFFQEPLYLTDVLEKVSNTLSPGMYLTNFSYQKQNSQQEEDFKIVLSGFAPSTDVLFDFRKNIENIFSTEVDVGDSWIKPSDFRFTFEIIVKR